MLLKCFHTKDRSCNVSYSLSSSFIFSSIIPQSFTTFCQRYCQVERVQHYFTKNLKGLRDKSYKERFFILRLVTLESRRAYNDLIFLYKLSTDFLASPSRICFILLPLTLTLLFDSTLIN